MGAMNAISTAAMPVASARKRRSRLRLETGREITNASLKS